jgi:predicted permease
MPDPSIPANDASLRAGWGQEVRARLAPLDLSPAREADIVDELSQHLDDRWRELVAGGAPPDEATRLALAEFRDRDVLARYLAPLRLAHQPPPITPGAPSRRVFADLRQDLRYAGRCMAASPGFTAVAVLSLALGIGATTAIFSLWNGVLRASLPGVHEPGQLVILSDPDQSGSWTGRVDGPRSWLTYGEFEHLRDHAGSFSGLMASQSGVSTWQIRFDGEETEEASGRFVSGSFFHVLGVGSVLGRVFTAADEGTETPTAVISHSYWQRRFGGRPDVLGRTVTVGNAALTIIGVTPRGFVGETAGQQPDLWIPLPLQPRVQVDRDRLHDTPPEKSMWLHVFGRLKPGLSLAQADAEANAIFHAGLESFYGPQASEDRRRLLLDQRLQLRPGARGASSKRPEFSQSLTALLAAVAVLLLIACANLANLLLARGAARKPEIALRLSLGASRGRLVRQLVTESLALAAIGGAAAIAVASVLHGALVRMLAESDPRFHMTFSVDPLVLNFVVASTLGAALLFGVLPAWQATGAGMGATLKEQNRGTTGTFGQLRSGRLLVSLQLALSLPLLVGAGLLARTVYNLQRADLGYSAERVLQVRVDLRRGGVEPARRSSLLRELAAQIQAIPGVRAASFSQLGVFSGGESSRTIEVEGFTRTNDADRDSAVDEVGPGYFSTLGVPIRLGRDIVDSDNGDATTVCVINEAFAQRYFDRRNPLGMRITTSAEDGGTTYHVVGVARNARTSSLRGDVGPRYYVAALQSPASSTGPTFLIRATTEGAPVLAAVRRTIERVAANVPIVSVTSIEEEMVPLTAQDRTTAQLAIVFGGVALMLAAIGLYGVLSYGVARRTGEIAIRIALGAQPGRVIAMILGETAGVVIVGLAAGAGLAYAASRVIESRLYGVAPQDPLTLTLATGLLLVVALGAAYLPALRASRVDPMAALRQY